MVNRSITLNVNPEYFSDTLVLSQKDTDVQITINFLNGEAAFNVNGQAIKIQGTKPSGLGFSIPATGSGTTCSFRVTEGMSDEAGTFPAEAVIGNRSATSNFDVYVERNPHLDPVHDTTLGQVSDDINQLIREAEDIDAKLQQVKAGANSAKTSEINAKTSETNAKESETKAKTSETNAKDSEINAKTSETNAKDSEINAKTSETNAKDSETKAKTSETNAKDSETKADSYWKLSKSYAVGEAGIREGEDTDNSKYYAEQAAASADRAQAISGIDLVTQEASGLMSKDDKVKLDAIEIHDSTKADAYNGNLTGNTSIEYLNIDNERNKIAFAKNANLTNGTLQSYITSLHPYQTVNGAMQININDKLPAGWYDYAYFKFSNRSGFMIASNKTPNGELGTNFIINTDNTEQNAIIYVHKLADTFIDEQYLKIGPPEYGRNTYTLFDFVEICRNLSGGKAGSCMITDTNGHKMFPNNTWCSYIYIPHHNGLSFISDHNHYSVIFLTPFGNSLDLYMIKPTTPINNNSYVVFKFLGTSV